LHAGDGTGRYLAAGRGDAGGSLFTHHARRNPKRGAGREPAPPALLPAKNNHGGVTFSGEAICTAARAGCCRRGGDSSSLGMKAARIGRCFCWGKRAGASFCNLPGCSPISGRTTPSRDSRLHRTAPTREALTMAGRGWDRPHDPMQAANSPHAFISLSVAVTHALRLPVYRPFSQGLRGGNDRSGGTGLLAQVLKGNPPGVWEREGRCRSRVPARRHLSEGMEATVRRLATTAGWLHPGAQGNAGAGIALAARRLQSRGGYHPNGSISKRSSVTSLEMVPTLPPFISQQCVSAVPSLHGMWGKDWGVNTRGSFPQ